MEQTEPKTNKQNMWMIGAVAVVILIGGAFFLTRSASSPTTNQTNTQESSLTQSSIQPTESPQSQNSPNAPVKEFTMTAKKFEFSPSTITVSEGDKVKLTINNLDVPHGFAIDELGIKEDLKVGMNTIEFVASKKGTFRFYCSIFCGQGHREMEGNIEIQ